jgi:hypothetical protein
MRVIKSTNNCTDGYEIYHKNNIEKNKLTAGAPSISSMRRQLGL